MDAAEQIRVAQSLSPEILRIKTIDEFFSEKNIKIKTDVSELSRSYLAMMRGYSSLRGGLPGVDEAINEFLLLGPSVGGRSRIQWVESMKPSITNLTPNTHTEIREIERQKERKKIFGIL